MNIFVFITSNQAIPRRIAQNFPIVLSVRQEDMHQQDVPLNSKQMDQHQKAVNFEKKQCTVLVKTASNNGRKPRIYCNFPIETTDVSTVSGTTKLVNVQQDDNIRLPPLTLLLVVQVFTHTLTHTTHNQAHYLNLVRTPSLTPNTASLLWT